MIAAALLLAAGVRASDPTRNPVSVCGHHMNACAADPRTGGWDGRYGISEPVRWVSRYGASCPVTSGHRFASRARPVAYRAW